MKTSPTTPAEAQTRLSFADAKRVVEGTGYILSQVGDQYRVHLPDNKPSEGYFTQDLQDAVDIARLMAKYLL